MDLGHRPGRRKPRPQENRRDHRHDSGQNAIPQRCEDQSYIQFWLNEVDRDDAAGGSAVDEDPRLHPRDEPDVPRERYFTDEQSLQRKITRAPRDSPLRASTEYRDDRSSRREELTIPASSSTGKEKRYAKRPRKKTRPDRYDTRKHNSKPSKQRETTRKQHRRKERKKELRSGKEVMQNFSSNALSNDRVIIKPSFAAGLFSNARIPNSTHVTDLAFNDMSFLARPVQVHERNQKSREKEERKISKDLQEEADFFDYRHLRRGNSDEDQIASPEPRNTRSATPETTTRQKKLRGAELQRLKIPVDKARPSSAPLQGRHTPSLPSLPQASLSDATYISWSTSPVSARHRRNEPTELAKEASISNSPVPASAIKRLIQTGVFDFAKGGELPAQRVSRRAETRQEQESTLLPKPPRYEDKGVMNSPWSKYNQTNLSEFHEALGEVMEHHGSDPKRCTSSVDQRDANTPAGRIRCNPFWRPGNVGTNEPFLTFSQLYPTVAQHSQAHMISPGYKEAWPSPRLPQILPSIAEVSQEISDTQQFGQHWACQEFLDVHPHPNSHHEGLTYQPQMLCDTERLYDIQPRGETMAEFIAKLEAEVLNDTPRRYPTSSTEPHEPCHGIDTRDDSLYYAGQAIGDQEPRVNPWAEETQDRVKPRGYDETEMTTFWRPNRFL